MGPLPRIGEGRGMKNVELYGRVRYAVQIEGLSERAAARRFGLDPRTVSKMMKFSVPPGYVRKKAPAKPKLDPFMSVIDGILRDDKLRPKKQQHTSKRIFERLRDERGFTGCEPAWNKDPVFGVIGIQSGPPRLRVHIGFHDYGSRGWDADC